MGCIDLNVNGKRWEGGVKDGKPFGYGVLYDEEGKKEYEGFMVDGVKMGYGIEYSNDIERVIYEGCFCDDKRFGRGVLYDRNGLVEYYGFWKNNEPYFPSSNDSTIDNHTESFCFHSNSFSEENTIILPFFLPSLNELVVGNECYGKVRVNYDGWFADGKRFRKSLLYDRNGLMECNGLWKNDKVYSSHSSGSTIDNHTEFVTIGDSSFNNREPFIPSYYMHSLKRIVIGDYCFRKVRVFELDGLSELESVVIGESSFMISICERSDCSCRIVNCPKLESIQIGYESFRDYHSFELNNLPSLQSIDTGVDNFKFAASLSLTGLIDGLV